MNQVSFYKSGMRIKTLESDVVNQIAAGEVLERPANLVKELLENSLDAGADAVEIHIADGGKWVEISDNGSGIHPEDLALSFARHATSKIGTSADLWQLSTYGFRGEALASISAVSKCKIISKQKKLDGAEVSCEFGQVSKVTPASREVGTTIQVQDLFSNVPARLKFLKSDKAEIAQIKKVVKAMALSYPYISFKFKVENKLLHFWSKCESLLKRVEQVLEIDPLFEGEQSLGSFHAKAIFSAPNNVQRSSQNIWIFVQDRWVQDRSIQAAVLQAYQNLLMHGEYPVAVVFLDCDPQLVDVNIHPTKSQVKFSDPQNVFRCVKSAIREKLEKAPWLEKTDSINEDKNTQEHFRLKQKIIPAKQINHEFAGASFDSVQFSQKSYKPNEISVDDLKVASERSAFEVNNASIAPEFKFSDNSLEQQFSQESDQYSNQSSDRYSKDEKADNLTEWDSQYHWSKLQVLGQLNLTYIVCQGRSSLLLVDQHAAHERVVFERLLSAWQGGNIEVQDFLLPLPIEIQSEYIDALMESSEKLKTVGIAFEKSGPEEISVSSAPVILKETGLKNALIELAKELTDLSGSNVIERKIADIFATMACHSVVRAGQVLSVEEMKSLLEQMDEFPLSSFCPHGRPVFVEYTYKQIDKSFGRIL